MFHGTDDTDSPNGDDMNNVIDANDIISAHFQKWNDFAAHWCTPFTGFAVWQWDYWQEARDQLVDGELGQIASNIVYSVDQERPAKSITEEHATEWLRANRVALIAALDAELAER